jgi:hypothetical protein
MKMMTIVIVIIVIIIMNVKGMMIGDNDMTVMMMKINDD